MNKNTDKKNETVGEKHTAGAAPAGPDPDRGGAADPAGENPTGQTGAATVGAATVGAATVGAATVGAATVGAGAGRFSYNGLERVIHEKARLSIMASLASNPDGLLFGDLKDLCALTDGNLSRHIQLLQESALVEVWKGFKKNRPQTLCRLTEAGRKRFLEYISVLESVVADALSATGRAAEARLPFPKGVSPA